MVEALPEDVRTRVLSEVSGNINVLNPERTLEKAWEDLGVSNFNSTIEGYIGSLYFISKKDFVKILLEIRKGDFQVGRFICPHCGKKNIKSKSGYTLHVKACSTKDHKPKKNSKPKTKIKSMKIPTM